MEICSDGFSEKGYNFINKRRVAADSCSPIAVLFVLK